MNLYRRHRTKCVGSHPKDSQSYESDEKRPKWKKCYCPIFASGKLNKFDRRCLDVTDWDLARAIVAPLQAANSWDLTTSPLPPSAQLPRIPPPEPEPDSHGKPVSEALAAWVREYERRNPVNTVQTYSYFADKIQRFADIKGYRGVRCFGIADIREFRDSWVKHVKDSEKPVPVLRSTEGRNRSATKTFFEFCVDNEWIEVNPARRLKASRGKGNEDSQKLPFNVAEIDRMMDACSVYGKRLIKWDRDVHHCQAVNTISKYHRTVTGEDLHDFMTVSLRTGLRISDVVSLTLDKIEPGNILHVFTMKNRKHVYLKLDAEMVALFERRAAKHGGRWIFGEHTTDDINSWTDQWRRKLNKLWDLCGPWTAPPTPHRFRHTFATRLLQKGVSARMVARLLGDTEEVVRKSYSAWVPEMQEELYDTMDMINETWYQNPTAAHKKIHVMEQAVS